VTTRAIQPERVLLQAAPPVSAGSRLDPTLRRGAVLFALQVGNVLLAYTAQVLLARWLGGEQFGVYVYAWAWANLLAVPAGLGLSTGVMRFIPTYRAAGDVGRLRRLVRWARNIVFTAGIVVGALCAALAIVFRDVIPVHYFLPLWVAFAMVPLLALATLHTNEGHSLGHPAAGYLPWVIGSNLGVIGCAALLRNAGPPLAAGVLLVTMLLVLALIVLAQRSRIARWLPVAAGAGPGTEARLWLRVSMPLLLSSLLYVLLERADLVLVGSLLGPREAGIYSAAARTALLASFTTVAITTVATPRIAELHAAGRHAELAAYAATVTRWTFWPSLAAGLVIVFWGGSILSWFGAGFVEGWASLALLSFAQVALASVGLAPHLLNMTGHQTAGAAAMAAAVALSLTLGFLLIPRLGMTGAAAATTCAIALRSAGHAYLAHRTLGIHTFAPLAAGKRAAP
jgi:O-antigen/teichoic acid export membrane protein